MKYFSGIKQRWRTCYLQSEGVTHCDEVAGFPIHPRREQTHLDEKLRFLKENHLNLYADAK
jgi:hypothetical protein